MKRIKRVLSFLLTAAFLLSASGIAMAAPSSDEFGIIASAEEMAANPGAKAKVMDTMKEFEDELHQLAALEMAALDLRQQEIEKRDQIMSLTIDTWDAQDKEALQEARALQKTIKPINEEVQALRKDIAQERKAFRQDCKNGKLDDAQAHIDQVLELSSDLNGKLESKIAIFDEIINTLS